MYVKELCSSNSSPKNDAVPDRAVYHIPRVGDNSANVSLKYLETRLTGLRQDIYKDLQEQLDEKFGENTLDEIREEMKNQTQMAVQQLVQENKATFREIRREIKRINRK